MAARLEIHLEAPYHAVRPSQDWPHRSPETVDWTMQMLHRLRQMNVHATFYVVGHFAQHHAELVRHIGLYGHRLGSHGYFHRRGEVEGDASDRLARQYLPECVGYCSPFWESTPRPGMAGGVFFRTLPYRWLKQEVLKQGILYLHPHDFFRSEGPLRRQLFFCNPWQRLERLLREVEFTHA